VILYRLFANLLLPVMLVATLLGRRWPRGAWRERLGLIAPSAPVWWVHGASLGELTSARRVIAGLAQDGPVLVTANTATGRAMVAGWGIAGVRVTLAPFDAGGSAARVIARVQPRALVVIENEFWPGRMAACMRAGVPVIMIGARMSARSAGRWRLAGGLMRRMLAGVAYLSAQDAASEARLVGLGLPVERLGARVNLKAGIVGDGVAADPAARARVVLAASTHAGEEGTILEAFAQARAAGACDLLILAPRHPERGPEVARMLTGRGWAFGQRSRGDAVPGEGIYLADTLGEMAQWYAMAGVTVIGGSFADKGGHTPFEPAAHGSAIVHGPQIANFAEPFAALDAAGGAVAVADGAALALALCGIDAARQAALADAARAALAAGGDVAGVLKAIRQHARGAN
jgi:3-deoxy-D-manno-octulosonic-acid transferase